MLGACSQNDRLVLRRAVGKALVGIWFEVISRWHEQKVRTPYPMDWLVWVLFERLGWGVQDNLSTRGW